MVCRTCALGAPKALCVVTSSYEPDPSEAQTSMRRDWRLSTQGPGIYACTPMSTLTTEAHNFEVPLERKKEQGRCPKLLDAGSHPPGGVGHSPPKCEFRRGRLR